MQLLPSLSQTSLSTIEKRIHRHRPGSLCTQRPPTTLPPHALPAAAAARCAGEQNRYWDLYAALFDQQNCLSCKGVLTIAAEEQLDTAALQTCMERKTTVAVINANRSEASLHNISATPTFVIGPTQIDSSLDGQVIEGALPWSTFQSTIDKALHGLGQR